MPLLNASLIDRPDKCLSFNGGDDNGDGDWLSSCSGVGTIFTGDRDGFTIKNGDWYMWDTGDYMSNTGPGSEFRLLDAGGGKWHIQSKDTGKCIYTVPGVTGSRGLSDKCTTNPAHSKIDQQKWTVSAALENCVTDVHCPGVQACTGTPPYTECCTRQCDGKCGGAPDGCGGTCTSNCSSGNTCANQTCVTDPNYCSFDRDCDEGYICSNRNQCIDDPDHCKNDDECEMPKYCGDDDTCVVPDDMCMWNVDCPQGETCGYDYKCTSEGGSGTGDDPDTSGGSGTGDDPDTGGAEGSFNLVLIGGVGAGVLLLFIIITLLVSWGGEERHPA
jgi:hypothetical protein